MAILGGSPLGLIGMKSIPTNSMSGFNQGTSNNVNVSEYNRSQAGTLFGGRRRLRAWPNISKSVAHTKDKNGVIIDSVQDTTGLSDVYMNKDGSYKDGYVPPINKDSKGSNLLHNNDVYDTSVLNILEKLSPTKGALKATDFAYLKYIGVYPNNRLMIARRFAMPTGDNIMVKKKSKDIPSIATLISWVPEGSESFVEIQFGEEWVAAKADFTGILNSLGDDFGKTGMGKIAGAAGNVLPLPGFTEIFQRKFLASLELLEDGDSIPAGNPNLIKEAKVRKTVPYGSAESGLMAKVSIKMTCEYELKFIAGIDPTIVWMDIIGMIVRFGTSESSNYGLSQAVAAKLGRWAADPYKMLDDIVDGIGSALYDAVTDLKAELTKVFNAATKAADEMADPDDKRSAGEVAKEVAQKALDTGNKLVDKLAGIAKTVIAASVMKYRVEMMGIVNALTGNPSTPWHITIGNPLRPIFCSGDMLVTETTLKLGPELAFNDLPSSIIAEFTLTNARNLGLQEIMSKFNSGYLRTVDTQKTFFESTINFNKQGDVVNKEAPGYLPSDGKVENIKPPVVNEGGDTKVETPVVTDATKTPTDAKVVDDTKPVVTDATKTPTDTKTLDPNATPVVTDVTKTDTLLKDVPGSLDKSKISTEAVTDQTKLVGGQK